MAAQILVVEDDAAIRENLVEVLSDEGHVVTEAVNLSDALRLVFGGDTKPDLIISDIAMQGQDDGLVLLQRVRRDPNTAATPVILLTARIAREDTRQGMNLGAQDYITKPFTRKELLESVNARLKQTHQSSTNSNLRVTRYFVSVISPAHPEGATFELQDITLVGRSKECQIQLDDKAVSRFHCTFKKKRPTQQPPGCYLVDGTIGKTPQPCNYGLWIDGVRVDGVIELKGGEKIQIAPNVFLEYKVKKPDTDDATSSTEF